MTILLRRMITSAAAKCREMIVAAAQLADLAFSRAFPHVGETPTTVVTCIVLVYMSLPFFVIFDLFIRLLGWLSAATFS